MLELVTVATTNDRICSVPMVLPILFAGPTLYRAQAIATVPIAEYRLEHPVVRGSVARVATGTPGCMVIVDGLFHESLAVGHAEIRDAMTAGWKVWGLSSMGAIRAREMSSLGMRGYGRVYRRFTGDGDFRDDEVALLHAPESPYRELSEPMVHIRAALDDVVGDGRLSASARDAVLAPLLESWYGDRTLARLRELVAGVAPSASEWIADWMATFDRYREKALDLIQFMDERPWASGL
jgi:hypothetical protein